MEKPIYELFYQSGTWHELCKNGKTIAYFRDERIAKKVFEELKNK